MGRKRDVQTRENKARDAWQAVRTYGRTNGQIEIDMQGESR